jgi:hypothetical protein
MKTQTLIEGETFLAIGIVLVGVIRRCVNRSVSYSGWIIKCCRVVILRLSVTNSLGERVTFPVAPTTCKTVHSDLPGHAKIHTLRVSAIHLQDRGLVESAHLLHDSQQWSG